MKTSQTNKLFRRILAASLLLGGTFNLAAPVLAVSAPPGSTINNTATATYDNDTDAANGVFNATSNTVTITVAEVAGIDVSPNSQNVSGNAGGTMNFDFKITNSGNDPTKFTLPTNATLSGNGVSATYPNTRITSIIYSTDSTFDGTDTTYTNPGTPTNFTTGVIQASNSVYVRVVVGVDAGALGGQEIIVKYGDTTDPSLTNQPLSGTAGNLDAYTVDATRAEGDPNDTAPINGTREDSAVLMGTVQATSSVLIGPKDTPQASLNSNTNTDFTNVAYKVNVAATPGANEVTTLAPTANQTTNPDSVTFTNTVRNNGNTPTTYTLVPDSVLARGSNLPNLTEVTITPTGGTGSVTYVWNGTDFTTSGTATTVTLNANAVASYDVAVNLPATTALSTNLRTAGDFNTVVGGYAVPITAFVDAGTGAGLDANDTIRNTTIDRTYVGGYVVMYKDAQITDANGAVVQAYTTDSTQLGSQFVPGNKIEYRIRYKNISEAGDTTNTTLMVNSLTITEDGKLAPNNWADQTDNDRAEFTNGNVAYFIGDSTSTPRDKNVTRYVNTLPVAFPPAAEGKLSIFRTIK